MENNSCYKNLKLLWNLRNIAIVGQATAIFVVTRFLNIPLQIAPLCIIIAGLALVNIFTFLRIKTTKTIKYPEFFIQLLADIGALFGLLYFTGGATNPFASLFILQVIIAAIALPPLYTWITALIAVSCYTLLMIWGIEVPYFIHHHMGDFFNLHVQGMWISFILLSCIVAWFIVRMNVTIKKQTELLTNAEKIAAIGTIAANAAHELGTPLATLSLLTENYGDECNNEEKQRRAKIFQEQITRCKQILSSITAAGGVIRAEGGEAMPLNKFIENIIEKWQIRKPKAKLKVQIYNKIPTLKIIAEINLIQAIYNLLDNAADSSPENVRMEISSTAQIITIIISDKGMGIEKKDKEYIGTPGYTTKEHGMGMGVFLAKTIITRFEGTIDIKNAKSRGTIVTVTIPIIRLAL